MQSKNATDIRIGENASVAHSFAASASFFGRLKDQLYSSFERLFSLLEDFGRAEEHGSVAVVTTGMHLPVHFTAKFNISSFLNRQCVHVRTEGDTRSIT